MERGFDFSGYRTSMLERRINKRLFVTECENTKEYFDYIKKNENELDELVNVFTINVSHFFRDPMLFHFLEKYKLSDLLQKKQDEKSSLRIWSNACSFGEEPYSMAILLKEFLEREKLNVEIKIFATDIDRIALKNALKGSYGFDSISNMPIGLFKKYFSVEGDHFTVKDSIKKMIQFSFFDMLDKKHFVPPASVFGSFDIVLCRNLLIYFKPEYQKAIFAKLYKSLNKDACLILGEAEVPVEGFKSKFKRENSCCKIYVKTG